MQYSWRPPGVIMAQFFGILFAIVLLGEPALSERAPERVEGPAQVVDTGELMDIFLKPAYAELQQAMAKPPVDRKEWATIYQKAVRLAELDNLLSSALTRTRASPSGPRPPRG